jgi:SET family sugar efflux transporter-like MFS transporter
MLMATLLFWTCSALYLISFPVYMTRELHHDARNAGLIFGLAAALEIPVMLLAARYVNRPGKKRLMQCAALSGMAYFLGLACLTPLWSLFLLQLFNAVFIALIASTGMLWLQDSMPEKKGLASTLFTNSVSAGVLIAGGIQGFVTPWLTPQQVWLLAAGLLFISLVIVSKTRDVPP